MAISGSVDDGMASELDLPRPLQDGRLPGLRKMFAPLASLRLTVVLLAMSTFLVFAGTLAQTEKDIWEVIRDYFRVSAWPTLGFAWIEFKVFFPPSFFPNTTPPGGGFYFPGGWLIGVVMGLNLLVAHLLRFKVQAKGSRLRWGLLVVTGGVLLGILVIVAGSYQSGDLPEIFKSQPWLRIMWQLTKCVGASCVMLAGAMMIFRKRGGIVLIHAGIALIMFGELLVGLVAEESQIHLKEGETVNFASDIRQVELAVIDSSDSEHDNVVVIPAGLLQGKQRIEHASLPFDLDVIQYYQNSEIRRAKPEEKNIATVGQGRTWAAEEVRAGAGTDTGGATDMTAAYVKVFEKGTEKVLGTFLVGLIFSMQDIAEPITVGEKTYDVSLRFRRIYKPYSFHLVDVRKDDYFGTDTPRNYSSELHLVDVSKGTDRNVKIWMNNPLRYEGETFYQSNYNQDETGQESTGLQVVSNTGWVIPYMACAMVGVGLLAHFAGILLRFLRRMAALASTFREEAADVEKQAEVVVEPAKRRKKSPDKKRPAPDSVVLSSTPLAARRQGSRLPLAIASLIVLTLFGIWFARVARPPQPTGGGMDLYAFGKIPVLYQGRAKPIDTLARNALRIISDQAALKDERGNSLLAVRWLLDVISESPAAEKHRVVRIQNLEVLELLGLKRRPGYRYAIGEFKDEVAKLDEQVELARKEDTENLNTFQRKVLKLSQRLQTYTLIAQAFRVPQLPPLPDPNAAAAEREGAIQGFMQAIQFARTQNMQLARFQPPLAIPVHLREEVEGSLPSTTSDDGWETFSEAWLKDFLRVQFLAQEANPFTQRMAAILTAYGDGKEVQFNKEVGDYLDALANDLPEQLDLDNTNFESFFNHLSPFVNSIAFYIIGFSLTMVGFTVMAFSWRAGSVLNWGVFCLVLLTFLLHTFALCARMYISGRPPVTNLYSSAVFIGWGGVAFGLAIEGILRIGIGNWLASVCGLTTLFIANNLAGDGDTFTVLQAVLDTQFWLATHVTCITFGYSATFLAALLGVLYILAGLFTPALAARFDSRMDVGQLLYRVTYGATCFAILFSFVGTVLGGLWADDSWGRFWGWDPKENGALMIVLWNALVLHARWGGMIRERGFAVMVIGGSIITAWSWFGVNELGVGLHSYGFTEGVLRSLAVAVAIKMLIIAMGCLPASMWWSYRARQRREN